jgi:hypothetical protein
VISSGLYLKARGMPGTEISILRVIKCGFVATVRAPGGYIAARGTSQAYIAIREDQERKIRRWNSCSGSRLNWKRPSIVDTGSGSFLSTRQRYWIEQMLVLPSSKALKKVFKASEIVVVHDCGSKAKSPDAGVP